MNSKSIRFATVMTVIVACLGIIGLAACHQNAEKALAKAGNFVALAPVTAPEPLQITVPETVIVVEKKAKPSVETHGVTKPELKVPHLTLTTTPEQPGILDKRTPIQPVVELDFPLLRQVRLAARAPSINFCMPVDGECDHMSKPIDWLMGDRPRTF